MQQKYLSTSQLSSFYHDLFVTNQINHFEKIALSALGPDQLVVDVGGGFGYFAEEVGKAFNIATRVIDADPVSVEAARARAVNADVGDALCPVICDDDGIACFNLILHHLVGRSERETLKLQVSAIRAWRDCDVKVFVNEYIYESLFADFSGRVIYLITSSKLLSALGRLVARLVPSLRANTFGVGVRFRSCNEWRSIFEHAGFDIVGYAKGDAEFVSKARRLLLISEIRRDSFLLVAK